MCFLGWLAVFNGRGNVLVPVNKQDACQHQSHYGKNFFLEQMIDRERKKVKTDVLAEQRIYNITIIAKEKQ
jgi:hypothetical protein